MARVASSSSWADIIDDDSNSLGALGNPADFLLRSKSAPSTTTTTAAASSSSSFDPELDCSRDGLNLAFSKGLTTTPVKKGALAQESLASPAAVRSAASTPSAPVSAKSAKNAGDDVSSSTKQLFPSSSVEEKANQNQSSSSPILEINEDEAMMDSERTASPEVGQKRGEQDNSTNDMKRARKNEQQDGEEEDDEEETVETDEVRLAWRAKQIAYGKNDDSYKQYIKRIPKSKRRHHHPVTPDVHRKCSKRAFGGLISAWRRALHKYATPPQHATAVAATSSTPATSSPVPSFDGNSFPPLSRSSSLNSASPTVSTPPPPPVAAAVAPRGAWAAAAAAAAAPVSAQHITDGLLAK